MMLKGNPWRTVGQQLVLRGAIPIGARLPVATTGALCRLIDGLAFSHARRNPAVEAAIVRALGCDAATAAAIARRQRLATLHAGVDLARWRRRPESAIGTITFEGEAHLGEAAAPNRGVVLASCHTVGIYAGSWQASYVLGERGYRSAALMSVGAPDYVATTRALLAGTADASLRALRDLKAGRLLFVATDNHRVRSRRALDRAFLGARCRFPLGAATLARLAQAPVVPAVAIATGQGRYTIRFFPALPPPSRHDAAADGPLTDRLLTLFETLIRAKPHQYGLYPTRGWSAQEPEAAATGPTHTPDAGTCGVVVTGPPPERVIHAA